MRGRITGPLANDLFAHAGLDLFDAVDRHFKHHRLRSLFKLLMHVTTGENAPNNGMMMPLIVSALSDNALPIGGSAKPHQRAHARDRGLRRGRQRRRCLRNHDLRLGRATGVRLADASRIEAKVFVASGIDAPATMHMALMTLPRGCAGELYNWHWGSHSRVTCISP